MGAHSTIRITRTAARTYLLNQLLRSDDAALEQMLDTALYGRLYNARLVDEDDENDNDLL